MATIKSVKKELRHRGWAEEIAECQSSGMKIKDWCRMKGIMYDGNEEKTYSYPYWFTFTPFTEVFPKLFPWANFSINDDFYKEEDLNLWHDLHCYYDKEIDDVVVVGDSFEEFRKSLPAIRGVDHSGEVAEYMLILNLNDLGESFLTVDNYVSQIRPYAEARPEGE